MNVTEVDVRLGFDEEAYFDKGETEVQIVRCDNGAVLKRWRIDKQLLGFFLTKNPGRWAVNGGGEQCK